MGDSPAVLLYDAAGKPLAIADGVSIPVSTPGLLAMGRGANGNARYQSMVTAGPRTGVNLSESVAEAIARNKIAGAVSGRPNGIVAVDTAAAQVIVRLGAYVQPTAAAQRSIGSTSANDTAAGTGARKVRLTYYDGSMAGPFTETVTLNGTTAVNTVATNIRFVESIVVTEVGSSGFNNGLIALQTGTGGAGPTIATMTAGYMDTLFAHHYVAAGRRALVRSIFWAMSDADDANVWLQFVNPIASNQPTRLLSSLMRAQANSPSVMHALSPPISLDGPARIDTVVSIDSSTAGFFMGGFGYTEIG